jgi:hypothetical protein
MATGSVWYEQQIVQLLCFVLVSGFVLILLSFLVILWQPIINLYRIVYTTTTGTILTGYEYNHTLHPSQ